MAISADAVTVTTNCRAGYNLSVATSVNDNNLYRDGSVSNNVNGTYFEPVDGINTLANNTNKWGYYYNSSNANAPTKTNVFSAVPASSGTPAALVTPTASETDISDSFNVYFGVSINSNLKAGTYKMIQDADSNNSNGSITYYLTMATSCMPYTVVFNPTSTASGSSVSGTGTMSSQTIPVGDATALNANTFVAPSGYEFDSWNTAQDGSGTTYADQASVTDLAAGGGEITLYAQWRVAGIVLYDEVAAMSKGKQTNDDDLNTGIQAPITVPTSADRTEDTSNSGVYEYDSSEFGTASDASNTSKIYYYRGVLENSVGSYGSDGSAVTYPNYVVLSSASNKSGLAETDTCWRIVRTTGSGGVKMIYNGKWTGSTCANAQTNAEVITSAFNGSSASNGYSSLDRRNIHAVGYTYNNAVTSVGSASANTTIAKVFGSSSDYSVNSSNSIIKQYIEQTWFSNISVYERILEPSAGYCNDRTLYPSGSYALANKIAEDTQIVPYGSSSMAVYYFGAYTRNMNAAQKPTLECPRGVVDIYSTTTASGGNGQLSKPVALLTADELSFAGSGSSTASQGSSYSAKSFLRSGNNFWLLSPNNRNSNGNANEFNLNSNGNLNNNNVNNTNGVRPAISQILMVIARVKMLVML